MWAVDSLHIYTDGSSYSKPRRGGLGVRFVYPSESGDEVIEDKPYGGYEGATNNQMELKACTEALKEAAEHKSIQRLVNVVIHTDSMYVVGNYKKAMFEWPQRKWFTRSGAPVLNAELWKELVKRIKKTPKRVEFQWVKGHSKNIHNKAADRLAKASAKPRSRNRIKGQQL